MEYQLIFSPRLDLTPEDFVAAWNAEGTTHIVAQAQLTQGTQEAYNNPFIDIASLVLSNVGLGLATNALYDLIKKACEKKGPKKHLHITQFDQPDGTHFLTIDLDEE